jgi:hypothetical protein
VAAITILSWNIETYGPAKAGNANSGALINFIARVISNAGANIVSLIELKNASAPGIVALLIPAIDLANGHVGATNWRSVIVNSNYNNEAYVLLYQLGNNFDPLPPNGAGANPPPVNGLTWHTGPGGAGPVVLFPSRMTTWGGRRPFFAAFTTNLGVNFSIISYHAPFGAFTYRGVQRVGQVGEVTQVDDGAAIHAIASTLICGDFNQAYNAAFPWPYNNLLALPSFAAIVANTSLVNNTPPGGYPNTAGYYINAYDNIFERNCGNVAGTWVDLILQSTTAPAGNGILQAQSGAFVPGPILGGALINNIPPQDFEDGWHIVRHGVSNHLPVWVTVNI